MLRDDEIVHEETPHGGEEPRRRSAERAPARIDPAAGSAASAPDPARCPRSPRVRARRRRSRAGAPRRDDQAARPGPTAGRVPDWLIARVEESIARQRERDRRPRPRDEDDEPRR